MSTTLKRLAPTLGTTSFALRRALIGAGLVDDAEKRPTAAAHALGCAVYIERRKGGECLRFPAWNRDALVAIVPSLEPRRDDVLRSYSSRWSAANAMREAALRMREARPTLARALGIFASDETKERIVALTAAAQRMEWAQTHLVPARQKLAVALAEGQVVDGDEDLAVLDGALHWLSTPLRSRCAPPTDHVAWMRDAAVRDVRAYDDQHSLTLSSTEWGMLETGYTFNHLRARADESDLVGAILSPLTERTRGPAAAEEGSRQPLRATRNRGRLVLGTITILGGMTIASAHNADRIGDRLSVQTEVEAYVVVGDDGNVQQEGAPHLSSWLVEMLQSQGAVVRSVTDAADED